MRNVGECRECSSTLVNWDIHRIIKFASSNVYGCTEELMTMHLQGVIQSSFLWGYAATQILGGTLADKLGGKVGIHTQVFANTIVNMSVRRKRLKTDSQKNRENRPKTSTNLVLFPGARRARNLGINPIEISTFALRRYT